MKKLIPVLLLLWTFHAPAQMTNQLPNPDLHTAFVIRYQEPVAEKTDWGKFKRRQNISNIMYVLALGFTAWGMIDGSADPAFWYVPGAFVTIGFIVDRTSYYVIKED